jgi:purine-binding chemotaxis protein CheW
MAKKKKISYASFLAEVEKKDKKEETQSESEETKQSQKKESKKPDNDKEKKPPKPKKEKKKTPKKPAKKPSKSKTKKATKTQAPQEKTENVEETHVSTKHPAKPYRSAIKKDKVEEVVEKQPTTPAGKGEKTAQKIMYQKSPEIFGEVGYKKKEKKSKNEHLLGQLVCFKLNNEEYGIHIENIKEINNEIDITSFPELPDFIIGVTRLRNILVPVMDLGKRFGYREKAEMRDGSVIMVNISNGIIGLVVDELGGTLEVTNDILYDMPHMFSSREMEYMVAVAKVNYRLVTILDVEKLLEVNEVQELEELQNV